MVHHLGGEEVELDVGVRHAGVTSDKPACSRYEMRDKILHCYQSGPLDVEIISQELIVMLRQLSYAINNQLKAPKAPY